MPKGRLRTEPADVQLVIHEPIPVPAIEAPTPRHAKALADRVHDVVSATVDAHRALRPPSTEHPAPSTARSTQHGTWHPSTWHPAPI